MSSRNDRWGPPVHSGSPLRPQKSMRRVFYKRDSKIKRLIDEIKQQLVDKTKGVKVRNIINPDTNEHGYYEVEPVFGINGVYRIQEHMLSEFEFYRVQYANRNIKDEYERKEYLESHGIQKRAPTSIMYAIIDYKTIQQLRMPQHTDEYQDARKRFEELIALQRIEYVVLNSKDKAAKFIYERGTTKQPREYGYIGRIRYTPEGNKKTYNLRDRRAIRINQIVLNTLFHGEIDKRNYEDNQI